VFSLGILILVELERVGKDVVACFKILFQRSSTFVKVPQQSKVNCAV
jgi:hypothetical protein